MLPEEVTKLIGQTGDTVIMEVERGAIRKYADAVGENNPLYWDDEYAKNSGYGSIIAPPGFFGWPTKWDVMPIVTKLREELVSALTQAGYGRVLDGGIEYEFFCPIRAGDILTAVPRIVDIFERGGKAGKLAFSITETTYTDQNGDLVAKARQTVIHR